jgi:hypothetical protein
MPKCTVQRRMRSPGNFGQKDLKRPKREQRLLPKKDMNRTQKIPPPTREKTPPLRSKKALHQTNPPLSKKKK